MLHVWIKLRVAQSRQSGVAWEFLQDCTLRVLEPGWIKAVRAQRSEAFARPLNLGPEIVAGECDVILLDWCYVRQKPVRKSDALLAHRSHGGCEIGCIPQDDGIHHQIETGCPVRHRFCRAVPQLA